jgi:hypothetical protein
LPSPVLFAAKYLGFRITTGDNKYGSQMHPVEKYKKIAQDLLAKAQKEETRRVRAELKSLAESYLLLALKTERNSWRHAKAEQ